MRRDDRDDPFDDFFREIERMMDDMMRGTAGPDQGGYEDAGFGSDTHLDVQETDGEVRIIGDFPGIEKDDISLQCDGRTLTISAATDTREYDERLELPCRVDERSGRATYNNGVLEVTFDRAEESADINFD